MSDKNYIQSIAGDLYHLIKAAQESGVNVDKGFRNQAMATPHMRLSYLFLGKNDLYQVPALPPQVKKLVRRSNALAIIELMTDQGSKQTAGIHLIWTSSKPCSSIECEAEVLQGIQVQGLKAFSAQMRMVMKEIMSSNVGCPGPGQDE